MPVFDVSFCKSQARRLLEHAGMPDAFAAEVAANLVESDLLGHRTHGLAMLPVYLQRLGDGQIAKEGEIELISDHGSVFTWQANRLPGAWVVNKAMAELFERIKRHPVAIASIANCAHIGSLQTYLEPVGRRNLVALMMVTDPGVVSVAPFGGIDPVLTTNPIAACIPTNSDPILIDQCTSLISNGALKGALDRGERLGGQWLLDAEGRLTDNPSTLSGDTPGTILPLGGEEFGYKGFAFGMIVEALALALPDHGRRVPQQRGSQGVFIQLIDPDAFGGLDAFLDETTHMARRVQQSRVRPGHEAVRLPGERALRTRKDQESDGLALGKDLVEAIDAWSARLGLEAMAEIAR